MSIERNHLLPALLIALGLAATGWFIGHGFTEARRADRIVSVKGLSEREVKADLALWPLRYVATGNDLAEVQDKIIRDTQVIAAFLAENGIKPEEFETQNLQVTDLMAQSYRSGPVENRYILSQLVMVRTPSVDKVAQSSQKVGELVKSGVVLMTEGMPLNPVYLFTRINDYKT